MCHIQFYFRYRMTPPESPRDRDVASVASVDMSAEEQKHREQGI